MSEEEDDRLDPATERAFQALPREKRPPSALEDRVVESLKAEGLLMPTGGFGSVGFPWLGAAAAAVVIAALGFASGAWWVGERAATNAASPRFLLLLHEPPAGAPAPSPQSERALVEEYKAWASEGARSGFLLDGEKLKDGGMILPESVADHAVTAIPMSPGSSFIGGYFLIRASGYDEALEFARTCPHLRHGGTIEVRQIDPV